MSEPVLARWRATFSELRPDVPVDIDGLYAPDIQFRDPIHTLDGIEVVRGYFARLNAGLRSCRFVHDVHAEYPGGAILLWTMHLVLARKPKRTIVVPGATHLRWREGRVTHQTDYFDAGALLYEQVPLLGGLVRRVKAMASGQGRRSRNDGGPRT